MTLAWWILVFPIVILVPLTAYYIWKVRSDSTLIGKERHDVTIAYGDLAFKVLGFAALVATFLTTLRTVDFNQENIKLSQQTFDNTLKTQAVERYTKAVEQLGADNESIQIGGIYALKSLLDDPDHHQAVVDLLASWKNYL